MRQTHSPHCISPGSMLQCCSEMWELLQTDTNGDSCPGREKICIESRQSFGSDIKNNPRRERAVHCSLHAAPAGCSLDAAVIHTAGIIVLCCRPSSAWPGNISTRLPRCGWTLLNLLIPADLEENPKFQDELNIVDPLEIVLPSSARQLKDQIDRQKIVVQTWNILYFPVM